jgi:hypothetical protein
MFFREPEVNKQSRGLGLMVSKAPRETTTTSLPSWRRIN